MKESQWGYKYLQDGCKKRGETNQTKIIICLEILENYSAIMDVRKEGRIIITWS